MTFVTSIWHRLTRGSVVRYLITGGLLFLIDLTVFLSLKRAGAPTAVSQMVSRTAGAAVGFFGHKIYSFRNRERSLQRVSVQGTGYVGITMANILISPIVVLAFGWLLPGRLVLIKILTEFIMATET